MEARSDSQRHNAPEDLAGAMGCYPTGRDWKSRTGLFHLNQNPHLARDLFCKSRRVDPDGVIELAMKIKS